MAAVGRAAPTNATVLIQGESGVGKELVARTIHRNSLRSRERFVQVNCAAIPEELIESELFGHEKGSFTGATEKQIGKFEQADRGTIFLDEVGDMSAKTQAKVLRVLQEGEVERLGSARTIKVDVRVIAATNKNLEEEIEKGQFREDLYFRLAVIPIHVPPLRERREDIPLLVRHFMELLRAREQRAAEADHAGGARGAAALPLEGQHPRAAQHRRAADHHDARATRSTSPTARSADASRPAAPRRGAAAAAGRGDRATPQGRHAARVQGSAERAFLVEQAARERLEHLEDRRSDRHAAQQSLQEAGAVPDHAGDGRVSGRRLGSGLSMTCRSQARRPPAAELHAAARKASAGGKSELRRAVRRVTPGQGNLKESGTENIPPTAGSGKASSTGKGEKVR